MDGTRSILPFLKKSQHKGSQAPGEYVHGREGGIEREKIRGEYVYEREEER